MHSLPIEQVLEPIIEALIHSPQVILVAPPGAGKSTWLPLKLLQQLPFTGKILLLEPRRLAARNVAYRLASLLDEQPGETVGYRMRGEQRISPSTRLEVVTEGVLTRRLQHDPLLEGIDLVILDEFHERNLQADLGLSLLLDIQQGLRDDLRILIMSATLDNQQLSRTLPQAPLIVTEGQSFPVTRYYHPLSAQLTLVQEVTELVVQILAENSGSLLIFMPGEREINAVQQQLRHRLDLSITIYPLYGALSITEQQQALALPETGRKIVIATNIAETSLSIPGISLVVDSTYEKRTEFDYRSGVEVLQTKRISQASMTQRAGRAGRFTHGQCWHLIDQAQAERLARYTEPEILRSDLSSLQLELLAWGCQNAQQLTWVDPPQPSALQVAQTKLQQLGALTETGQLSGRGRRMAELGGDPRLAAVLTKAESSPMMLSTAILLVALLESSHSFVTSDLRDALDDPSSTVRQRIRQLQQRFGIEQTTWQADFLLPLLLTGFADQLAYRRGQTHRYLLASGGGAKLSIEHNLSRYPWLIVLKQQKNSQSGEASIQLALPIDFDLLRKQYAKLFREHKALQWDEERQQFRVWRQTKVGEIIVNSRPEHSLTAQELQPALIDLIRRRGLSWLPWSEQAKQLRCRIACAAQWLNEESWPAVDDQALLDNLTQWLGPELLKLTVVSGLKLVNLEQGLRHLLNWSQQQQLDRELPTHYTVPTGSCLPIRYQEAGPPVLAVRVQEIYGQAETPRVALARIPLVLELLSPAQRPLQVTQDLAGFWSGAWSEVKKEMKGRYPKHLWPDNPATAQPTKGTKHQRQS